MKAGARKSYGEYKPLIITEHFGRVRTEVLGQRSYIQKIQPLTKFYDGPTRVKHNLRGLTFPTREEAVAYAEAEIRRREARDALIESRRCERLERYRGQV
jgi:hypothetical protein